jgi:hypothetical protein
MSESHSETLLNKQIFGGRAYCNTYPIKNSFLRIWAGFRIQILSLTVLHENYPKSASNCFFHSYGSLKPHYKKYIKICALSVIFGDIFYLLIKNSVWIPIRKRKKIIRHLYCLRIFYSIDCTAQLIERPKQDTSEHIKEECHKMMVEMSPLSSSLGLN